MNMIAHVKLRPYVHKYVIIFLILLLVNIENISLWFIFETHVQIITHNHVKCICKFQMHSSNLGKLENLKRESPNELVQHVHN